MPRDLDRLLRPRSIAVVGGGEWCQQVVKQSLALGFSGDIFRVHPSADPVEGLPAVPSLTDLPYAPDAVFLGINRHATLEAIAHLSHMGAGGAVCFASGFAEASAEDETSVALQADLVSAAGDMPVLGPNCYGFINALDGALLWPDQHGCTRVGSGVAILTQSSNIAINLTMQRRSLPIAFTVTCGNMAQTSQAEIATALLDDDRVTAIGLHVEGFGDIAAWHGFARKAHDKGVPVVVLKTGVSDQAQRAAISHTASMAGSDAGAGALLKRLGMARVRDLSAFLETLMVLHCNGPLRSADLSSISCSGGEASLVADVAEPFDVRFPDLTVVQKDRLAQALGPMVSLSNPLDYHTYIWGDQEKMTQAWLPMAASHISLLLIILDYPHTDPSAWECATRAAISVRKASGQPVAVVSTLPELLPENVAAELLMAGVTPLHGLRDSLAAVEAAASIKSPSHTPPLSVHNDGDVDIVPEAECKARLARFGVSVPRGIVSTLSQLKDLASQLNAPLVLKVQGLAHKSEAGAVKLHLDQHSVTDAAASMPGDHFLIEEMEQSPVCELLVGVTRDAAHGFVLTLAAGGVLTEIWQDRVSMLLPITRDDASQSLTRLRIFPLLAGYRGAPAANLNAIVDAIMAVQDFVVADATRVVEVEINPLMCTVDSAVAADALIARLKEPTITGEPHGPD